MVINMIHLIQIYPQFRWKCLSTNCGGKLGTVKVRGCLVVGIIRRKKKEEEEEESPEFLSLRVLESRTTLQATCILVAVSQGWTRLGTKIQSNPSVCTKALLPVP